MLAPSKHQKRIGDRVVERQLRCIIRWNAMAMVVRAAKDSNVGGHISTFASAATLYEIGFNHFFHGRTEAHPGDAQFRADLATCWVNLGLIQHQMGNLAPVGHDLITLYGHLSAVSVVAGQHVVRGQIIGYVGQSGRATGPHLHYEVRVHKVPINPHKYLRMTYEQASLTPGVTQHIASK